MRSIMLMMDLLVCAVATFGCYQTNEGNPTSQATTNRFAGLRQSLTAREYVLQRLPSTLGDGCELDKGFDSNHVCAELATDSMDEWSNPIAYEVITPTDFRLISMGPDGEPANDDDLVYSTMSEWQAAAAWEGCYLSSDTQLPDLGILRLTPRRSGYGGFEVINSNGNPDYVGDSRGWRWVANWESTHEGDSVDVVLRTIHEGIILRLGRPGDDGSVAGTAYRDAAGALIRSRKHWSIMLESSEGCW